MDTKINVLERTGKAFERMLIFLERIGKPFERILIFSNGFLKVFKWIMNAYPLKRDNR